MGKSIVGSPVHVAMGLAMQNAPDTLRPRGAGGARIVQWSRDLERILALPEKEEVEVDLTEQLLKPGREPTQSDPKTPIALMPVQSAALYEAKLARGLVAFIRAGDGKSGIALLIPTVVGAKRAVIITRSQLLRQMMKYDIPLWCENFDVHLDVINFVTYEQLSDMSTGDILDKIDPDIVIADEGHKLKNRDSVRVERFLRFFGKHPDRLFFVFSGTLSTKSINDYVHFLSLALKERSPCPREYNAIQEWSQALDAKPSGGAPYGPGALERLRKTVDEPIRVAYQRRLFSTLGVVRSTSGLLPIPLHVHERKGPDMGAEVEEALKSVRKEWRRPDGEELEEILVQHAVLRQLAGGFYRRWCKERYLPEVFSEWMDARSEWHKVVREMLKHSSRPGWDSRGLLARHAETRVCVQRNCTHYDKVELGETCSRCGAPTRFRWVCPAWQRWKHARDTVGAKIESEVVWLSSALVQDAVWWGRQYTGAIWYRHPAVGQAIAQLGNFPLYGAGEKATAEIANEKGDRTIVISVLAHGEGKNLQMFPLNLIVEFLHNVTEWEQLFARAHRRGVTADRVDFWVYRHTLELRQGFDTALAQAKYLEESTGLEQRILQAGKSFDHGKEVNPELLRAIINTNSFDEET